MHRKKYSIYTGLIVILVCFLISTRLDNNKIILVIAVILGLIILFFSKPNVYPVRLIYAQIIYNCIVKFGISYFNIPNSANYLTDIFTFLIVIFAIIELRNKKFKLNIGLPVLIVLILLIVTICGFIINSQSILLYIWGFRNNFRFFGFLFGCVVLLKKKDIDVIFKMLLVISLINTVLVTGQYFIFRITRDNLGGIFGVNQGVNGSMNIFLCIVCILSLVQFVYNKINTSLVVTVIVSSIYIASLSELKVFFIELIIIIVCILVISKPTKKTFLVVLGCAITIFAGVQVLYVVFPEYQNYFNIDTMIASGKSYSTGTDLGRITATKTITSMFLNDDKLKYLFGLGLGSAETSQIAMFSSQFFNQYGETLHYSWLSSAFMLIETGWIGLISYLSLFISVIYSSFRIRKNNKITFDYCVITQVFAILCCFIVFYNSSLRTEIGYLAYFMLALPFAISNKDTNIHC